MFRGTGDNVWTDSMLHSTRTSGRSLSPLRVSLLCTRKHPPTANRSTVRVLSLAAAVRAAGGRAALQETGESRAHNQDTYNIEVMHRDSTLAASQ